ncbi:MAG: hypothetical protein EBV84_13525 [Betaproteobacteria bacterium]|nr:hypothetical protein [Betaproteobacteria bacterium]
MKGLIDPAMMIEAVIIPTLNAQLFKESVHGSGCSWMLPSDGLSVDRTLGASRWVHRMDVRA